MAIPCKEPEGFGGASFQLNLDAVREYTPTVGQIVIMIHFPLNVPKDEDMDTTEHGQYSIGIMRKVFGGTYDTTYVYVVICMYIPTFVDICFVFISFKFCVCSLWCSLCGFYLKFVEGSFSAGNAQA